MLYEVITYQQFSADLMGSERPDGLDELALEQYELLSYNFV